MQTTPVCHPDGIPERNVEKFDFEKIKGKITQQGLLIACHSCLLITFANSLNPDQAPQSVKPDLDPSSHPDCLIIYANSLDRDQDRHFKDRNCLTV